jgi:hypothetical protein
MVVRYCVRLLMVVCMWLIRDTLGKKDVVLENACVNVVLIENLCICLKR